jgi:hypothetical protein
MANNVKLGSVNFPKLMRHVGHRTNQVRDLVFMRDAIFRKVTKTHDSQGSPQALSGPAVNFGYEDSSSAAQSAGTNTAYHVNSPELILPGLKAVQTPIISRSGELERTGHRITGSCTFYMPSLSYIKSLDNFSETTQFDELETYDKLLDVERIIQNPDNVAETTQQTTTFTFSDATAGYEVDRVQFKIKTGGTLDYVQLSGNIGGSAATLKWDGSLALSSTEFVTVDLPVRDIAASDTTSVYKDGTASTFTAALTGSFDIDKLYGDSSNELSSLIVQLSSSSTVELKEIYLYKSAEWRVETIKDFRDEYMEVGAVRVRGDRTSRRRAYG